MWSLERRPHTLDFYIRRVFRIWPLAAFTILAVVLAHIPVALSAGRFVSPHHSVRAVAANLLLSQNLLHHEDVEGVLWSLPLEVEMYIVLPALFVFARREKALWPIMLLWALAAAIAHGSLNMATAGNSILTVLPHFLPGVIAYVGFRKVEPRLPAWIFPPFLLALAAVFMARLGVERGWFTCLILGLALPRFRQLSGLAVVRVSHELAKYSYGIYLLHPWALAFAFGFCALLPLAMKLLIAIAGMGALAVPAYHLIEDPFVRLGKRVANVAEQRYEVSQGEAGELS